MATAVSSFYEGRLTARVQWDPDEVGGDPSVTISELTSTLPEYALLLHGALLFPDPETGVRNKPREGTFEMRSLTFAATVGTDLAFNASDVVIDLAFNTIDGEEPPDQDRVPWMQHDYPIGNIEEAFVGQDADGPLTLVGRWSIIGSALDEDGNGIDYNADWLGVGNARADLFGAFGAEVAP